MYTFPIFSKSFLSSLDQETLLRFVEYKKKFDKGEELPPESKELLGRFFPELLDFKDYIFKAVVPAMLTNINGGAKLTLPLIDKEILDKQDAIPYFLWGMFYDSWKPTPEEGTTVFFTGFQNGDQKSDVPTIRGENNEKKKIYYSALTPDLFPKYEDKVVGFWEELLDNRNANKPLMGLYLDLYFYLYWDLHLGVERGDIIQDVLDIGRSFMNVIGYLNPLESIVYTSYMDVREKRQSLNDWIKDNISSGSGEEEKKTFVHYWLKNSEQDDNSKYFNQDDIIFECFHNFLAFSQWGNTIYNIIERFINNEANIKTKFETMMNAGNSEEPDDKGFSPLDYFVMELFRWISPNSGSISNIKDNKIFSIPGIYEGINLYNYHTTPHEATSDYEIHWTDPGDFNPDRYKEENVPTSDEITEEKCKQIGFVQCPFHKADFNVDDGRNAQVTNSGFGTVYNVTEGKTYPVIDYAGYAPFGFGYRRCPGELFTVFVIKEFLKKVWNDGNQIQFKELDEPSGGYEQLPLGPRAVLPDKYGFETY
ncbi:hypothetical protein [Okeania sp. SIO2B3]|uniref:hypothetical protein n=1 Tax=Okeania sp. SIO2B3 TaxID=2607784 RepID=UPI0013BF8078|nr:hypothetical protein [Okeania sp. SIO2B3]NET44490.1 hypothetical protein [Okeania sp. SIO2B3]